MAFDGMPDSRGLARSPMRVSRPTKPAAAPGTPAPRRTGRFTPVARSAIYLLAALAYGLWFTANPVDTPLTQPDSAGYLAFSSSRTAAYPIFLKMVAWLSGDVGNVVYAQLWIYVAAIAVLGRAVHSVTGSHILAAGVVAATMINPEINEYHFVILTESLFISLMVLILALVIRFTHQRRWQTLALISFLIGLAIAVRPVGYGLLTVVAAIGVLFWSDVRANRRTMLAAAILPAVAVMLLEYAVYAGHHGLVRESLAARHIFAKSGLVATRGRNPYPAGHPYRELWRMLEIDLEPVRALIAGAPNFAARNLLLDNYEVYLQYQFAGNAIARAADRAGRTTGEVMADIGRARLIKAPGAYLGLVADHFRGVWTVYASRHPGAVAAVNAYLEANRPLPYEAAGGALAKPIVVYPPARFIQPALLILGAMTFLAMTWLVAWYVRRRRSRALTIAGLAALMVNANFLLVALAGLGIPRYTVAMWPAIIVSAAFLFCAMVHHLLPARWSLVLGPLVGSGDPHVG